MRSKLLGGVAALGLVGGVCGSSLGAVVASDSFQYNPTSSINGQNGGAGWLSAWNNGLAGNDVTLGGLSYPGLEVAGNKLTTDGGDVKSLRTIAGPKLGNNGETLWVGFLASLASGSAASYGGVSLFNDTSEVLFMGDLNGSIDWGFKRSGGVSNLSSEAVDGDTQLLVYRITFGAGNETVDMWLNPALNAVPADGSRVATASVGDFRFNTVRLASGSTERVNVDELRIGTSFGDVAPVAVPSPTAVAAGVVGMAWVALRKWLRRR